MLGHGSTVCDSLSVVPDTLLVPANPPVLGVEPTARICLFLVSSMECVLHSNCLHASQSSVVCLL